MLKMFEITIMQSSLIVKATSRFDVDVTGENFIYVLGMFTKKVK